MSKIVRITESQLKTLIENEMMNEIDFKGLVQGGKNLVQKFKGPPVKAVTRTGLTGKNALEILTKKFSRVPINKFVMEKIVPLKNEVGVINNDIKRILALPDSKTSQNFFHFKLAAENVTKMANDTKILFPDIIYHELSQLKRVGNQIITNKELGPRSATVLKQSLQNIDDAIRELEVMLSQFG